MDRFPEAFRRFEEVVDVSKIKSFQQLKLAFATWAGRKWKETPKQVEALKVEAVRLRLVGAIEVSLEDYLAEKREIDVLYRRVYYARRRFEYNKARFDEWSAYLNRVREEARRKRWRKELLAEVEKPLLPRLEKAKARMEHWQKQWNEAYEKLKAERERFRLKIVKIGRMRLRL
jgi:hypothetical protein